MTESSTSPVRYQCWSADDAHVFQFPSPTLAAALLCEHVITRYADYLQTEGLRSGALFTSGVESDDGDAGLPASDWLEVSDEDRGDVAPIDTERVDAPHRLSFDTNLPRARAFGAEPLVLYFDTLADARLASAVLTVFHQTLFASTPNVILV